MLTIAEQLQQTIITTYGETIDNATCNAIYSDMFKLSADQSALMCQNSTFYNFKISI